MEEGKSDSDDDEGDEEEGESEVVEELKEETKLEDQTEKVMNLSESKGINIFKAVGEKFSEQVDPAT